MTVDLFNNINIQGYNCEINWLLKLNVRKLQNLFKSLEDIWNYRSQISSITKRLIAPPDGLLYSTPLHDVYLITDRNDLLSLILNNINKINNGSDDNYKKIGFMYFIIGLSEYSRGCYESHQWWLEYI